MPFAPSGAFPVNYLPDGNVATLDRVQWTGSRGDTVTVEAGTVTDWATIPWFLRGLLGLGRKLTGAVGRAALIHDELCYRLRAAWAARRGLRGATPDRAFTSNEADGAFRLILDEQGVPLVLRWLYWTGVRWGALWSPYRRAGWWRTAPGVLLLTVLYAPPVLLAGIPTLLAGGLLAIAQGVAWLLRGIGRAAVHVVEALTW